MVRTLATHINEVKDISWKAYDIHVKKLFCSVQSVHRSSPQEDDTPSVSERIQESGEFYSCSVESPLEEELAKLLHKGKQCEQLKQISVFVLFISVLLKRDPIANFKSENEINQIWKSFVSELQLRKIFVAIFEGVLFVNSNSGTQRNNLRTSFICEP
uniref:NR LBD domain-containing protein n=1 Tax=Angiostrongylus cantonensis TaxID=6313 RepID=A0A0K0CW32_ANGCA